MNNDKSEIAARFHLIIMFVSNYADDKAPSSLVSRHQRMTMSFYSTAAALYDNSSYQNIEDFAKLTMISISLFH